MTNCNSCGQPIPNDERNNFGAGFGIRREWGRRGWRFCDNCVFSRKARAWAEKEEEKIRTMK